MPYIKSERRDAVELYGYTGGSPTPAETAGELNYQLTVLCKEYMKHKGLSYATINDIVGALEGAKLEFVRQVVNPYEDLKIKENGGLY
jgi:hypothetical protein